MWAIEKGIKNYMLAVKKLSGSGKMDEIIKKIGILDKKWKNG